MMYMFIGWGIGEEEIRPAAQEMGNLSQIKRLLIISTANQVSLDRNFCLLLVKSPSSSDTVKPGSVSLVVPKVGFLGACTT